MLDYCKKEQGDSDMYGSWNMLTGALPQNSSCIFHNRQCNQIMSTSYVWREITSMREYDSFFRSGSIFYVDKKQFCQPSMKSSRLMLMDITLSCLKVSFHTLLVFFEKPITLRNVLGNWYSNIQHRGTSKYSPQNRINTFLPVLAAWSFWSDGKCRESNFGARSFSLLKLPQRGIIPGTTNELSFH